jgi:hypothetical protein
MKNRIALSIALLFMVAVKAQWGKKINGNGNIVTIERSTSSYDGIAIAGWFDVELVEGSEGKLTLKGEENLLEYIVTEVKDGKLVIQVEKGINLNPSSWKNGIFITVPVESVSSVSLSGSGDIIGKKTLKTTDFATTISGSGDIVLSVEAQSVSTTLSGSGDVTLSGRASDLNVQVSGSGDVKAFELETENATISVSGSADVKVTASKSIKARVSGSGDIQYRGNPEKVDSKSSGSGDISKV